MTQEKHYPGQEIEEEVVDTLYNGTCTPIGERRHIVTQKFNSFGIKIRKCCTTCKLYKSQRTAKATNKVICRLALDVDDSSYLCKCWEMAEDYKALGDPNAPKGRVKCREWLMWYLDNNNKRQMEEFDKKYPNKNNRPDFYCYLESRFEHLYGMDIYGNKIEHADN